MTNRVKNLTGPQETGHLGYGATDLGAMVNTQRGIYMLKGDSFSGGRVGDGKWMSPIADYWALTDMTKPLKNIGVVGTGNGQVEQLHEYPHNNPIFSTVLPTDVVRLPDGRMVQHYMVVAGLGNTKWTEFWESNDEGQSWSNTGVKLDPNLFGGFFVMLTFDYRPEDGYVYILGTGWRDRGCVMVRCHPNDMLYPQQWERWHFDGRQWQWRKDMDPTPVMQGKGFKFGEMCLRFIQGNTVLSYFDVEGYCVSVRVIEEPTDDWYQSTYTKAVRGTAWPLDDGQDDTMAQLYGGYIIPGSRLNEINGFGLLVSQWKTDSGWPYRIVQFSTQVLAKGDTIEYKEQIQEVPPPAEPEEIVIELRPGETIEVRCV